MSLRPECLRFFAEFIEKNTGIIYSDVNYYQLENRLNELAPQLGCADAEKLWVRASTLGIDPQLKLLLLDTATNNETLFFRDPAVFAAIANLLAMHAATQSGPFRIWSAACSTGQELYSVAMLALEQQALTPSFRFSIFATDFSHRVLARAESGTYSELEVQRGLSPARLQKYFSQDPGSAQPSWQVRPELKQTLSFRQLNLVETWPSFGPFELILCRNVLIYQNVESKIKVIAKLADRLAPQGCVILGGAESMIGLSDRFEFLNQSGAVIYRRIEQDTAVA